MNCPTLPPRLTLTAALALATTLVLLPDPALAQAIPVGNASFESPATTFVNPFIDGWRKTPQPSWFDPAFTQGVTWDQLSGAFANPAVGQANRKENMEGNQGVYFFALPGVGLLQELSATYQAGLAYQLTVGLTGGGGGMPLGTAFQLGLYYLDGASLVPLASTTVTHSTEQFPTTTRFVDVSVSLAGVEAGQAWVGKPIGVQLVSASGTGAGYWDLDHVRVEASAVPEPGSLALLGLGAGAGAIWLLRRQPRR